MSDTPADILAAGKPEHIDESIEQQIFVHSPFGIWITTFLLFALMLGSYVLIAWAENVPMAATDGDTVVFINGTWQAFVLSVLLSAALGMQRYSRIKDRKEIEAFAKILTGGMQSAWIVTRATPHEARLKTASVIGFGLGIVLAIAILSGEMKTHFDKVPGITAWFLITITLMMMEFTRGVEQSRTGHRAMTRLMDKELIINLLRIDDLSVIGRSAARIALVWFVVSASACLFFIGGEMDWYVFAIMFFCAGMGAIVFVRALLHAHDKIAHAKTIELEKIRAKIEAERYALDHGHDSHRMQSLLAYEARIASAQEWPFDQSTLVRLVVYLLIPTIPWFGQAIAQYAVESAGRLSG